MAPSAPSGADDGTGDWAALVPELLVTDLDRSRAFYCSVCGFSLRFARPEDGFLYLQLGSAQIMLEQAGPESWLTGPLEPPFGRGINLQIEVAALAPLVARLNAEGIRPFRPVRFNGIAKAMSNTVRPKCWYRILTGIFCASSRGWDSAPRDDGRAHSRVAVPGVPCSWRVAADIHATVTGHRDGRAGQCRITARKQAH
jgi:catechol 2,3-dioxygenase-like lactoylglutathione lyase family enzyme